MKYNKQFLRFYCLTQIKRSFKSKLKFIIMLIPVYGIILLFSTIQDLPSINQKLFLNNCKYSKIAFTEDMNAESFLYFVTSVAASQEYSGNMMKINAFCNVNSLELDNTLFTKKNQIKIKKNLDTAKSTIILSYNVLINLGVKIGDTVSLMVWLDRGELLKIDCIVSGYTKPYYGNILENNFDTSCGLACINLCQKDINTLKNSYKYKYVQFDGTDDAGAITYDKTEQKVMDISSYNSEYVFYLCVFPVLSIILIFIIVMSEFKYILKRNSRTYGIYNMLGVTKTLLRKIYVSEFMTSLVIASSFSIIFYKYIIMKFWIKEYVPFIVIVIGYIGCIILGYIITKACVKLKNLAISNISLAEEVSKKL